jgi:subtilase family serine protease
MSLISKLLLFNVALAQSEPVHFVVALKQQNVDQLYDHVLKVSDYKHVQYGQYWTHDHILDLIEPPVIDQKYVLSEFHRNNIQCVSHRDALSCVGTTSNIFKYFTMESNVNTYTIPITLRPYVDFIEGLTIRNNPNEIFPIRNVSAYGSVDTGYVGREVLLSLYNVSSRLVGDDHGLAAIEYQGNSGFSQSDLLTSQVANGMTPMSIADNHTIGNDAQPDTETELDLQEASLLAPGAELWFWGSSDWLYTWAVNFFNTKTVPMTVSHSWGWASDRQCTVDVCNNITSAQYVNRVNVEYLKIAARGVTMVASSGDSGAPGRSNEMCNDPTRAVVPIFPGSSPFVFSVGATYVVSSNATNFTSTPLCQNYQCTTGNREANVNFGNVSWTAGGGFGEYATEFTSPWQTRAVKHYLDQHLPMPTSFNKYGRAYPDASAIGHNCPTWEDGALGPVDGTSCSSPLFASILSTISKYQRSKGKPTLGLAAPLLYAMYYNDSTIFNDITVGNNWCTESLCCDTRSDGGSDYGYLATKGYDPVTGLGTPNVGKMIAWLDQNIKSNA